MRKERWEESAIFGRLTGGGTGRCTVMWTGNEKVPGCFSYSVKVFVMFLPGLGVCRPKCEAV